MTAVRCRPRTDSCHRRAVGASVTRPPERGQKSNRKTSSDQMNTVPWLNEPVEVPALPASPSELVRFLAGLCARVGADHYLVARIGTEWSKDAVRIVASNWMFDTVEILGPEPLATLATAPETTYVGAATKSWRPFEAQSLAHEHAARLSDMGHREIVSMRLRAAPCRYVVFLSAEKPGALELARIPAAVMSLSYALATVSGSAQGKTCDHAISERERECLGWVAEGKTTMDIATILGVSANTINSYLAHVIQKLSARNRAMAIAVAIRSGLI